MKHFDPLFVQPIKNSDNDQYLNYRTMKNNKTTSKETTDGWEGTKTPNKRAHSNHQKLQFLNELYHRTRHGWRAVNKTELARRHGITSDIGYLIANRFIERRGVNEYRWRGAEPTLAMANEWNDVIMASVRRRRDPGTVVKQEHLVVLDNRCTGEERVKKYLVALQNIHGTIKEGRDKHSLSDLCMRFSLSYQAGLALLKRGCIKRPSEGITLWNGDPPDQEMAQWLCYEMKLFYHKMSERRKAGIPDSSSIHDDAADDDPPVVPPYAPQVAPASDLPYWDIPVSTWSIPNHTMD